jgi:four helix bundle protein
LSIVEGENYHKKGRIKVMTPDELKKRTKQFGLRIIRLAESLPDTKTAITIGNQLLRCGTSVGANYRAACRGRSKAEFIAKLGIVEEEADESAYWLEMLVEAKIVKLGLVKELHAEAEELTAITAKSRLTARRN